MPPIEIAFRFVSQQSRVQFVFADNGNLWRIRESIFHSVGKPVSHGVAHDNDRGRRRDCIRLCFRLFRRRRARVVNGRLLLVGVVELPLAAAEEATTTEKTSAARSLRTLPAPESVPEKLRLRR